VVLVFVEVVALAVAFCAISLALAFAVSAGGAVTAVVILLAVLSDLLAGRRQLLLVAIDKHHSQCDAKEGLE
jgi:hypothetical protein